MSYATIQVVANADASDLKDDYQQAHAGTVLSSNGHSVTMRIFATAQECCDALAAADWLVYMASTKPEQDDSASIAQHHHKKAVVVAVPFPSKPFVLAAQQGATPEDVPTGKLQLSFALDLTAAYNLCCSSMLSSPSHSCIMRHEHLHKRLTIECCCHVCR